MAEGNERSGKSYGGGHKGYGDRRPGNRGGKGFKPRGKGGFKPRHDGEGFKPRRREDGEGYAPRRDGDGEGHGGYRKSYGKSGGFHKGGRSGYRGNGPRRDGEGFRPRRDHDGEGSKPRRREDGEGYAPRRDGDGEGRGGYRKSYGKSGGFHKGGYRGNGPRRDGDGEHGGLEVGCDVEAGRSPARECVRVGQSMGSDVHALFGEHHAARVDGRLRRLGLDGGEQGEEVAAYRLPRRLDVIGVDPVPCSARGPVRRQLQRRQPFLTVGQHLRFDRHQRLRSAGHGSTIRVRGRPSRRRACA